MYFDCFPFYFTLKAFFVLKISNFFLNSRLFYFFLGHAEKRLDKKAEINFKIYDVIYSRMNNYNTHIAEHINIYS